MEEIKTKDWYAVAVYVRQEKAASIALEKLGIEVFLPEQKRRRLWSDRIKIIQEAYFPGYLFVRCHMTAMQRRTIIKPRQVWDLVGRERSKETQIAPCVPEGQINSIKILEQSGEDFEISTGFSRGTVVKVIQGPFKGAVGKFEASDKKNGYLILEIPILGRGVKVKVFATDVASEKEFRASRQASLVL